MEDKLLSDTAYNTMFSDYPDILTVKDITKMLMIL